MTVGRDRITWTPYSDGRLRELWLKPEVPFGTILHTLRHSAQDCHKRAVLLGLAPRTPLKTNSSYWTAERTARAKLLTETTGLSASEIAEDLRGGISRSAVIGKAAREGWIRPSRPAKPAKPVRAKAPTRAALEARDKSRRPAAAKPAPPQLILVPPKPAPSLGVDPWAPLAGSSPRPFPVCPGECNWPLDDPEEGPGVLRCCEPVRVAKPGAKPHRYCPIHHVMGYQTPKAKAPLSALRPPHLKHPVGRMAA